MWLLSRQAFDQRAALKVHEKFDNSEIGFFFLSSNRFSQFVGCFIFLSRRTHTHRSEGDQKTMGYGWVLR
jgi:hypothetical protein